MERRLQTKRSAGDLYKDMRSISQQEYGQLGQQGHVTPTCDSWEGQVIRNPGLIWMCTETSDRWRDAQMTANIYTSNVTGH